MFRAVFSSSLTAKSPRKHGTDRFFWKNFLIDFPLLFCKSLNSAAVDDLNALALAAIKKKRYFPFPFLLLCDEYMNTSSFLLRRHRKWREWVSSIAIDIDDGRQEGTRAVSRLSYALERIAKVGTRSLRIETGFDSSFVVASSLFSWSHFVNFCSANRHVLWHDSLSLSSSILIKCRLASKFLCDIYLKLFYSSC